MNQLTTGRRWGLLALLIVCALLALAGTAAAQDSSGADSARAGQLYTVARGDDLESIAADFDVSTACLLAANDIDDPDSLAVGAELIIPSDCSRFEPGVGGGGQAPADAYYTVRAGDRLSRIARDFETTVACLVQANGIRNPDLIYIGQEITIPVVCQDVGGGDVGMEAGVFVGNGLCLSDRYAGRRAVGGQYVVPYADMLDFIGCDFNLQTACLAAANGLPPTARLTTGQVLFIDRSCPPWDGPPGPRARGGN